jgi:hypothetical protein
MREFSLLILLSFYMIFLYSSRQLITLVGMATFLLAASMADSLFQFTAVQFCTMLFVGGQGT